MASRTNTGLAARPWSNASIPAHFRQPFRGEISDVRLYCTRHDMQGVVEDSKLRIGATDLGNCLAGEIIAFAAKPGDAELAVTTRVHALAARAIDPDSSTLVC